MIYCDFDISFMNENMFCLLMPVLQICVGGAGFGVSAQWPKDIAYSLIHTGLVLYIPYTQ